MMRRTPLALAALLAGSVLAQPAPAPTTARQDALDPTPVNPATDPDARLFLNDWRNARPRTAYGGLVFHDILTRLDSPDPLKPSRPGAVLQDIGAISRATLAPGASAHGQLPPGQRAVFYTSDGSGQLDVLGKTHKLQDGVGFVLTGDFPFRLVNTGKAPLGFYVRSEAVPPGTPPARDASVTSRWNNDRRIGAHWLHICNGGPPGMLLCTIAPNTMPQPHSHNWEELWLLVKGESVLMLGKQLLRMHPGQAYKIPPSGLAAHSNLNLGTEPLQMLYFGPAVRTPRPPLPDFAQLQNTPIDPANAPDIDMFMGHWRNAYPRIDHGNLYVRDLLTGLTSADPVRPQRTGAVLLDGASVSHAMLEPGATAHPVPGDAQGLRQLFMVTAGTGTLVTGGQTLALAPSTAFALAPGQDFQLTASGTSYLGLYVLRERAEAGAAPAPVQLFDWQAAAPTTSDWHNVTRALPLPAGQWQHASISLVELGPLAMSRPHSAPAGTEEIWIALDDMDLLLGKQLRQLKAGTAYKVPPTGITAQANINLGSKPVRLLHIVRQP
jgi:mannose-6-phosphate isomerase-like protein (cupin superfamily)